MCCLKSEVIALYAIADDNSSWRPEKWLTELLCLSYTVVSAAALPTTKKTPFITQEGLCNKGEDDLFGSRGTSDDVFTFEGVSCLKVLSTVDNTPLG